MPTLEFKGKSVVETHHHAVPHHRLELDAGLSVLPDGSRPSVDGNLIVEGDNLLALKALLPTHAGRIKCVYIDPPYNTGNEGWIYNDNLTQPQFREWIGREVGREGEDGTRHDKWCCMMYPRLMLLRELLREDGSIWVSIDDHEAPRLRLLMDEVFGEDRFVAQVAVLNNRKGRGLRAGFASSHDLLLVYTKTPDGVSFEMEKPPAVIEREYPERDDAGPFRLLELRNTHRQFGGHNRPNLRYALHVDPGTGGVSLDGGRAAVEVWPDWEDGFEGCWSWSRRKVSAQVEDLVAREVRGSWKVYRKGRPTPRKPKSVWHKRSFLTERGQRTLTEVLGSRAFHAPKPVGLLVEILDYAMGADGIVLDACAGSGTMGHAVLRRNRKRGASCEFILIQRDHDSKSDAADGVNICRDITRERIRRVISGDWAAGERDPAPGSFTYARVGPPLFTEYRDLGEKLPTFEDLARYIHYTETSRDLDPSAVSEATGLIGSTAAAGGTSYYLLYTPDRDHDAELSADRLRAIADADPSRELVIYTEKL